MILCFSFSFNKGEYAYPYSKDYIATATSSIHSMVMEKDYPFGYELFEQFMQKIHLEQLTLKSNSDGSCPELFSLPSEDEGIHFITSDWGVIKIDVTQNESLTPSWLNEQVHRVISTWAEAEGYSEYQEYSNGLFYFVWVEPKDPTE